MKINAWFVPLITLLSTIFTYLGQWAVPIGWVVVFAIIILIEDFKKKKEGATK